MFAASTPLFFINPSLSKFLVYYQTSATVYDTQGFIFDSSSGVGFSPFITKFTIPSEIRNIQVDYDLSNNFLYARKKVIDSSSSSDFYQHWAYSFAGSTLIPIING